jgi:hypothetical protein
LRRIRCEWFRRALAVVCVLLAVEAVVSADEPAASPPRDDAPINIFLGDPADVNAIWKALAKPDFVILRGDEYNRLLARSPSAREGSSIPWAYAIGAVAVEGTVEGDLAKLTATIVATLAVEGPAWVTIRLDGQILSGAREGSKDLPLRAAEGGTWQVELKGRGRHTVRVALLVPVRQTPEGKRFELAVPEAASTRIEIVVPQRVTDASAGAGEPVATTTIKNTGQTRLAAELTPRARLGMTWRVVEAAGVQLPPLLAAQGEIAVDIDAGSFSTISSWSIRSVRGMTRNLVFRLDPDDEVLELELDGQPPPAGTERVEGGTRLKIPLAEPLGPGKEHKLVMTTRRPISAGGVARVDFHGFPLADAHAQDGAIGIAATDNLFLTGSVGRGVRQVDPRTELPNELRARPATDLAYRFSEQPFELTLRVEPSPPLVRAASRTTVVLDPGSARVDTWLDLENSRGQLFDLSVGLPPGLEVESVGPKEAVGSWQTGAFPSASALEMAASSLRAVSIRLAPRVQEGGRFSIHLVGRQRLDASNPDISIALFRPLGAAPSGGLIAVLTDPSLTAERAERGEGSRALGAFRAASQTPPGDWPWPSGRPPASPPMLWLRHDDAPSMLPLRVATHPRTLSQATSLTVHIDANEAEVQQDTECSVQFGSLDHLDVTVPSVLEGRWDVEGIGTGQRVEVGRNSQGDQIVRLKVATELTRSTRLRFRYRIPLHPRPTPGMPAGVMITWVKVEGATGLPAPVRATVVPEGELAIKPQGTSWTSSQPAGTVEGDASALRLVASKEVDVLELRVSARALADLPRLVVPRLALRTIQGPEGDLRTTASYWVETHESSLTFALPAGTELLRVRVGGELLAQVEPLLKGAGFRFGFPAWVGSGPALVELEYSVPASNVRRAWPAPRLEGGLVQQSLWEVRLPWSRAVLGVPSGWVDENEWYWDDYVLKRRPWMSSPALAAWVGRPPAKAGGPADFPTDADSRGDYHSYLFSRPGAPGVLAVTTLARAWLVAVCSGVVLVTGGMLILVWRPSPRLIWVAALVLGLSVATLFHPSVTFLAVQSGMVGVVLTALIAAMQWVVERRRPVPALFGDSGTRNPVVTPGSTLSHTVGAGSDDSTAIRPRPNSTMDHVAIVQPTSSSPAALPESSSGRSPLPERAGRGGPAP